MVVPSSCGPPRSHSLKTALAAGLQRTKRVYLENTIDQIARRMAEQEWTNDDIGPAALAILEGRVAETGRHLALLTSSDLVKGVPFHLPNVHDGQAYQIAIHDWHGLDRAIIGDFLGYISTRSYLKAGFMGSALVV